MEHKSFAMAEFKALEEPGTFDAIVAVFGNVDYGGDRVMPGAFQDSLKEWKMKGRGVPILWSHDSEQVPIGVADDLVEVKEGLKARGAKLFVDDNPVSRSVYAAMKGGALPEFSFGYGVAAGGARKVVEGQKTIRELHNLRLDEISPVFRGMNPATRLIGVKSFAGELENLEAQRAEIEKKIAEMKSAIDELPSETVEPKVREAVASAVSGALDSGIQWTATNTNTTTTEQEDKPNPNGATASEEDQARIRALTSAFPEHLE